MSDADAAWLPAGERERLGEAGTEMVHRLIGCYWGRALNAPGDEAECPERATQVVVVHQGPEDVEGVGLKLCDRHAAFVLEQTAPRTARTLCDEVADGLHDQPHP